MVVVSNNQRVMTKTLRLFFMIEHSSLEITLYTLCFTKLDIHEWANLVGNAPY